MKKTHVWQEWQDIREALRVWWVWPAWFFAVLWVDMMGAYSVRESLFGPLMALLLLLLAVVDVKTMTLPDLLNGLLVLLGFGALAFGGGPGWVGALAGVVVGYASFRLLDMASLRWGGKGGMGQGDAKLFAALGAWVGVFGLPLVALVASLLALAWLGWARPKRGTKIGFGPFLALGGWVVFLYQPVIWGVLGRAASF